MRITLQFISCRQCLCALIHKHWRRELFYFGILAKEVFHACCYLW